MANSVHILRYGTLGDRKSILSVRDKFDYLTVNANMIAHTGGKWHDIFVRNWKSRILLIH